ncbi:MAG: hypothetical protein EPN17_01425 [Methylobacter sp.]|nr:MAG: hypothetical protein EPN17_01425 [Methylobacter sp.]
MLVFYSGWGYWSLYSEEIDQERTEEPERLCGIFELPSDKGKELEYQGITTAKYLVFAERYKHPDVELPNTNFPYSGEARFVLCKKWKVEDGHMHGSNPPILKKRTYTSKDVVTNITDEDIPKGQAKSERDKMLILILGMAVDAYEYDISKTRNTASGGNKFSISEKIRSRGYSVSNDVIQNYLKEAKILNLALSQQRREE